VIVALGAVLVVARRRVEVAQARFHRVVAWAPDADRSFSAIISGTTAGARRLTRIVQNGSLPIYLMVILGVAALAPLAPALGAVRGGIDLIGPLIHLPIAALIVGAAVGATVVHRRIAAALMLGAVGFAMAGFYVSQGAPDLALTQVAIETLATVLFVLVLRFLPRRFADVRSAVIAPVRIAVSVLVGASVFVLALVATASRDEVAEPSVSGEMIAKSVPEAKGANVVNVILVDFRGLDTLGEITVLVVAGLGVVALARTVWVFDRSVRSFARLPLVELSSRLLYPSILVLATYFLFAGHNQPGGGFVGGLTAGAAVSLRYVSGGVGAVRDAVRVPPWTVLAGGLVIAAGTALLLLLSGGSVLEHLAFERSLPLLGTVKSTTALPFDIGVFLVVVGLVLMAYEAFGDEADIDDRDRSGTPRADDGASRPPEQTAEVTA
jgi:multicomponent Na+:H+ antiporter subunit A